MHFYLSALLVLCVVTDSSEFQSIFQVTQMRAAANAPQAAGFKCLNCNSEFGSRRGVECHRRHTASIGTPCADPSNHKSLSFTGRAGMSTGILRQHNSTPLGVTTQTY